jgi:hypothetical protein
MDRGRADTPDRRPNGCGDPLSLVDEHVPRDDADPALRGTQGAAIAQSAARRAWAEVGLRLAVVVAAARTDPV